MGRKGNYDLSGSDFKDPLTMVLGKLGGFTAGRAVFHKDTFEPVCTLMEITEDQYGKQDGTNALWVHRWIGEAMKALRGEGLTEQGHKRGRWQLTEEGVERAQTLCESHGLDSLPAPETDEDEDDEAAPLEMTQPVDEYHRDAYLRSLALAATNCRGNYSDRSRTCKRCALQQSCRNLMAIELSALAAVMRKEHALAAKRQRLLDENRDLAKEARPEEADGGPIPAEEGGEDGDFYYKGQPVPQVEAVMDTVCVYGCGESIRQGECAYYVVGDGCYHPGCLQKKANEDGD